MILEPASAVAVSRCLLSRNATPHQLAPSHPRPCAWEDYGTADLAALLADFNVEAGFDERWNRYADADVQRFHCLPHPEQQRRIALAQYASEAA